MDGSWQRHAAQKSSPSLKQTFYNWYWTDTDSYLEYVTTATAINDLEAMTAKLVNTQPIGGTLVANGYLRTTVRVHEGYQA